MLLLGTARAERDWPIGKTARTLPRSARCALVREVFSPNAFDELYRYVNGGTGCAMKARVAGRVQVTAMVGGQPANEKTGLEPIEWLFDANEECRGQEFVILGPKELSHSTANPTWLQLMLIPVRKDQYRFAVSVGGPNKIIPFADVEGEARRRGGKWTLTPARDDRTFDFSVTSKGSYASGQPIPLQCKFTNLTSSTQTIRLPERQSGAPAFLSARVWNDRGRLLTKHDGSPDGWWSVHVLDSRLYQEAPGDRVEVEAEHDLIVDVDLAMILRGSRSLRAGSLPPGRYRVQLDSAVGPSNEITIEVTSASERRR